MKIGMVTEALAHLPFDQVLDVAVEIGVVGLEVNTGNWSSAPHCDLAGLLNDERARKAFSTSIEDRGLELFALNANGNQLHPTEGAQHSAVLHDTIRLAGMLGVDTVVLMSGLPAGAPGDVLPNWIVTSWPLENADILRWQWEEKLLPYWRDLAAVAASNGVHHLAIELHAAQLVFNAPTLLRLRNEIGPVVGANLDPSHTMWMGGEPLEVVDMLGDAIFHVHAKDTYFNPRKVAVNTCLENGSLTDVGERAWNYVTLGYGHDDRWWREFCYRLQMTGYDGWLSIEQEDMAISRLDGLRKSFDFLKAVAPAEPTDFPPQAL